MEAIHVTQKTSTAADRSLHNLISWRQAGRSKLIVAIGSNDEHRSSAPLPPSTITTDLLAISTEDPATARALWGAFLSYLAWPQVPQWHLAIPRFLRPRLLVVVQLPPGATRIAVCSAISRSTGRLRFKASAAA